MMFRSIKPPFALEISIEGCLTSNPVGDGPEVGYVGANFSVKRLSEVFCTQYVIAVQLSAPAVVKVSCVASAVLVDKTSRTIEAMRDFMVMLLGKITRITPYKPRSSIFVCTLKSMEE
jgi:hypothetical protein